ncbi:hypothetical protein EON81_02110 [bacterium]|nr:MAG: hypothetical protein EON81_02110 [bacterium]
MDRRLVERVPVSEDRRSNPLYPFPGGTSWVTAYPPRFMSPGYPLYGSIDRGRRASAVWSIGDIAASWGGRRLQASFGGVSLQQVSLLDYPTVVGRVSSTAGKLPEYRDFPLLPIEPYVPSEIRTFDLATQEFKKVCSGVYALPL